MQHVLTGVKRRTIDQAPVPALVDLAVAVQFADIKAVAVAAFEKELVRPLMRTTGERGFGKRDLVRAKVRDCQADRSPVAGGMT